ncbi:MAG: hypothetical protein RLZZ618_107 [Pseudomonadota bacterium]|jgi:DNA-binding transcriptional LysR family regulator
MLDLQQLRYFVAVADTESVARAAAQLHISQSPLSRQVIALEAKLGLTLFTRARQRLTLTLAGRAFLTEARELLQHAQRVERHALANAEEDAGTLVIGFVESAVHCGAVRHALTSLRRAAPNAKAELRQLRTSEQVAAQRAGTIDVGFTHGAPPTGAGLESCKVADEPFVLAMPSRHALAKGVVTADRLDGQPFIGLPAAASPEGQATLREACRRAGFVPHTAVEAADPSVVLGLVQAGLGLAIVQASMAAAAPPGVKFRPLPEAFTQRLSVYRLMPKRTHALAVAMARG